MVSSPRISIGPAGCRINRDYARRGWATGRRADVRATVPAVQGPLAGPSECSFGARRISSGCWPNWAEGGTETGHPGEGPGTRVRIYMQTLHTSDRQTTQTEWGAACEG